MRHTWAVCPLTRWNRGCNFWLFTCEGIARMPLTLHTFQMCPTTTSPSSYGRTTFYCSRPRIVRNGKCRSSRCLSFCQALYQRGPPRRSRTEEIRKCHELDFSRVLYVGEKSIECLVAYLPIKYSILPLSRVIERTGPLMHHHSGLLCWL